MFAVKSKKANKTNSFVRVLGESTAHQSAFGFIWPLPLILIDPSTYLKGFHKIKENIGIKYFERITHRGSRHQGMCPQKSHQSFSVTKQDVENQDKVVVAKYLINNLWNWGQCTVLSHASIANFPNLDFVFFFEKFRLF